MTATENTKKTADDNRYARGYADVGGNTRQFIVLKQHLSGDKRHLLSKHFHIKLHLLIIHVEVALSRQVTQSTTAKQNHHCPGVSHISVRAK